MQPRSPFRFLIRSALAAVLGLLPRAASAQAAEGFPADEEIRAILRTRIDTEKRGVGLIVGLLDEHGSRTVAYGKTALEGGHAIDGKTIFEIGSITKVFTATLLEEAVEGGTMKLADPVAKYLPAEVKVPGRGGKQITLLDLATHRSGLPRMPENLKPADEENPAADYTAQQMFAFLSGYTLTRDIGSKFEYSNLGVGLLGEVLARQAGKGYETLVREKICQPLGMVDTGITLTPELRARLAMPYDETLNLARNWDFLALAGAGALRSDTDDLVKFLAANLGLTPSPLVPTLLATHKARNSRDTPGKDIGLAWHISQRAGATVTWHNGGTAGYRSFLGFDEVKKRGVIVLSNTANDVDDIGFHLLDPGFPLSVPPRQRTAIKIQPEIADRYVGRYAIVPQFVLTFTREGDRYFLQATDQGRNEVFPGTESDFFIKGADISISFVKDGTGKVTDLILHQNGDQTAHRLP